MSSVKVAKNSIFELAYSAEDPDGDKLDYVFEIMPESTDKRAGGDKEKVPEAIEIEITSQSETAATIKSPRVSGAYRLFIYIHDGKNVATANIPFYVK